MTLFSNQELHWTFSGLNLNISQCDLDPVHITVQIHDHATQVFNTPESIIRNSSFGSLDLNPGTKAQIIDSYIDGEFKQRSTLITANNSNLVIRNSHIEHFINEKGSTVLYAYDHSHVIIDHSIFIRHNSLKGVLALENNCSLKITNSLISHNVASLPG